MPSVRKNFVRPGLGDPVWRPAGRTKKGRTEMAPRPAQIVSSPYLDNPTLLGAGAGAGLLAQAPRLRAAVAIATIATTLTKFTMNFPSFPGMLPEPTLSHLLRVTTPFLWDNDRRGTVATHYISSTEE